MKDRIVAVASLAGAFLISAALISGCATGRPTDSLRASGDHQFEIGAYNEAVSEYAQIIDKYPGDWRAQYQYGLCQLELNNNAEARRALEIAHTRKPANVDVADALSEAMFRLGDESRLFAFLRERAQSTQSVHAYLRLGRYAMEMNDIDSARSAIRTAIALDGGQSTEPYLMAADLAERIGELDAAVAELRLAYGVNPRDKTVIARLRGYNEIPGPTLTTSADRAGNQPQDR